MGSAYVNDFDFNNRSYRVYVQADQQFRSNRKDIERFYVRSDSGAMMPLDNLVSIAQTTTPQVISHFNLFRSVEIDGSAAPGYSSGQAIAAMEELAEKVLPQGITYSGRGFRLKRSRRADIADSVWAGLAARVPDACRAVRELHAAVHHPAGGAAGLAGRAARAVAARAQNDVYLPDWPRDADRPVGKNGILIVEFAEQLRARGSRSWRPRSKRRGSGCDRS